MWRASALSSKAPPTGRMIELRGDGRLQIAGAIRPACTAIGRPRRNQRGCRVFWPLSLPREGFTPRIDRRPQEWTHARTARLHQLRHHALCLHHHCGRRHELADRLQCHQSLQPVRPLAVAGPQCLDRAGAAADPALAARPRRHRHLAPRSDPDLLLHPDRWFCPTWRSCSCDVARPTGLARRARPGCSVLVRVTPKSARDGIDGIDARRRKDRRSRCACAPLPRRARPTGRSRSVVAQWLGLAKSACDGGPGGKSRIKTLDIDGEPGELEALIAARVAALQ